MILENSKKHRYMKALSKQSRLAVNRLSVNRKPRRKLKRFVIASVVFCTLMAAWLAFSFTAIGTVSDGNKGVPLVAYDRSTLPQAVIEDAARLARELYGESQEQYDRFLTQLLATYSYARDKDFIILFSPGGWGGALAGNSADWLSILAGIESELDGSGYSALVLNYQRTINTLQGRLNELKEMVTGYSSKATELAYRIEFITAHNPDIRIILAGESTGTVILDDVMNRLKDDLRVFSIQTGTPFWHTPNRLDRTLTINNNGITPDSFSEGNALRILFATLNSWLSDLPRGEATLMNFIAAPGHEYWWRYPGVYLQIDGFLKKNFGLKAS